MNHHTAIGVFLKGEKKQPKQQNQSWAVGSVIITLRCTIMFTIYKIHTNAKVINTDPVLQCKTQISLIHFTHNQILMIF